MSKYVGALRDLREGIFFPVGLGSVGLIFSLFVLHFIEGYMTVGFVYGDSQRWAEHWKKTEMPGNSAPLISAFFFLGIKAIFEIMFVSVKILVAKIKDAALALRAQYMLSSESGETADA